MATTKAPKKRTASPPPPPKRKKPNAADKAVVPSPREKETFKLTPAAVQSIIDLTLMGCRVEDIRVFLQETYGVKVSEQTVFYHRRQNRAKMLVSIDEDIAAARAAYPEGALLVGRLEKLEFALKKIMKSPKLSGYAVASLVSAETDAVYKADMLRLRLREHEKKYPEGQADESERILRELERRSHVMRNITDEVEEIQHLAGGEFRPDIIEGTAEIVPEDGNLSGKPNSSPGPAGKPGEEIGEDALTQ